MTINFFCFLQSNTGRCSPRGTKVQLPTSSHFKTTMTSATEGLHGHTGSRWSTSSNKVNTNKADMHRSTSWKHRVWIPQDLVTVIFSLLYLLFSMNSFYTAHSFFFTQFATAIVVRTINNNSGDICSSFILFRLAAAWCVCGLWFL